MSVEFIDLNSLPVDAVNCDNRESTRKEKWRKTRPEKSTKNDNMEFRKKTRTKWIPNLRSIKNQDVSCYYGKNWKVILVMKIGV